MNLKKDWKSLSAITAVFLVAYHLPIGSLRFDNSVLEGLYLVRWYAQEHVILCLLPAFLIAGAIAVFVSRASVMKYLGAGANKILAYGVASISGGILAVCSCTILPLFAGIYRMGAGLGPATAFLYAGPAINVLAIILTARVLGLELGIARAIGAILFSIVIGLLMQLLFRNEKSEKAKTEMVMPESEVPRPLWQNTAYFAAMVVILVFANWGRPENASGLWHSVYSLKWIITGFASFLFAVMLIAWFGLHWLKILLVGTGTAILALAFAHEPMIPFAAGVVGLSIVAVISGGETGEWLEQSWDFAKQILPLLLFGVLIAGLLLGRPGEEGLIPTEWISDSVGGNSVGANLFASVVGAFMYFATLTEVPILQGLIGNGMGKGPALALLLAGPALSLPNMLVIRSIIGTKKTVAFSLLVMAMATVSGLVYGLLF
jgi:uncharacterized membrane protein YraQ (UPF0718 family)